MDRSKWFLHPVLILICSILALGTSLFLYIYWYVEASKGIEGIVHKFNLRPEKVLASQTWVVILVLSILVGLILMGIFIIFVYHQKTLQLYRLQHNFINNFTHELKTPVTSLRLFLETLTKYELPRADQLKYIGYMLHDVGRLADNISRILNLARIESKTYHGEFITSDLVSVVEQFLQKNRHLFGECDILVRNPLQRPFPYRIDPSLFEMLLMNLLTNAVKYTAAKVPRIEIVFELQPPELRIRFRDNGMGLEKSEIRKIFRKFYQVGHSENMSAIGSGIGLFLVENIARIHQGKVVAESEGLGRGSVFTLVLPYRETSIQASGAAAHETIGQQTHPDR